ncbi:Sugar transporter, putative (DUF1195) [Quillaja saponaria]|uniref:Sugar transporter, putative (DUF1195) n=1 Tax=Quillaja saponaria TaxID=32244 RepID=A0AAD7LHJ4_QUISA|nr:Sugar transporter, putative (DUF1195) [Quillaja saponaria]
MKNEAPPTTTTAKRETSEAGLLGKNGYKFWVITAILLLAFWSMFTSSVTLKWSAGNLTRFSDDFDSRILDDFDVLEVEEREKMVKHMWDVYTQKHSTSMRLPRFWLQAFQAAYENLASDVAVIRNAAVTEIAKMSLHSFNLDPLPFQSKSTKGSRKIKQAEDSKVVIKEGRNQ